MKILPTLAALCCVLPLYAAPPGGAKPGAQGPPGGVQGPPSGAKPGAQGPVALRELRPPTEDQIAMRMMIRKLLLDHYDKDRDQVLGDAEKDELLKDARDAMRQQAVAFARRFDKNGDGMLSRQEQAAMQRELEARRANLQFTEEGYGPDAGPPQAAKKDAPKGGPGGRNAGPGRVNGPSPKGARAPKDGGPRDGRPGRVGPNGNGGPPAPGGSPGNRPVRPAGDQPDGPALPSLNADDKLVTFMTQQLIMAAYDTDKNGRLSKKESEKLKEDGKWLLQARREALLEQYDADGDGKLSEKELDAAIDATGLRPKAPSGDTPPPPPPAHAVDRLLDTHFDLDILLHLAFPQGKSK